MKKFVLSLAFIGLLVGGSVTAMDSQDSWQGGMLMDTTRDQIVNALEVLRLPKRDHDFTGADEAAVRALVEKLGNRAIHKAYVDARDQSQREDHPGQLAAMEEDAPFRNAKYLLLSVYYNEFFALDDEELLSWETVGKKLAEAIALKFAGRGEAHLGKEISITKLATDALSLMNSQEEARKTREKANARAARRDRRTRKKDARADVAKQRADAKEQVAALVTTLDLLEKAERADDYIASSDEEEDGSDSAESGDEDDDE